MEKKLEKDKEHGSDSNTDEVPVRDPNVAINEVPGLPPRTPRTPDSISKLLDGGRPDPVLDHRELENFALQIATGMTHLEKLPVTHRADERGKLVCLKEAYDELIPILRSLSRFKTVSELPDVWPI
ncbi:hypothetical protein NQ317_001247 [Molorchus minor]|uniref:Uncharacterized protein n=1 Tax=Molorchus minor TaxID=1323400 RepID=A0ABQ9J264_9CUCU|nr:hypothetical protein NQ317_001247 [Molorchus minor]